MKLFKEAGKLSYYRTALEYYDDQLLRLDAHLRRLLARERSRNASTAASDNKMRGLFLSDDEIGRLLVRGSQDHETREEAQWHREVVEIDRRIAHKIDETLRAGVYVPLLQLARSFRLNGFETDFLFMMYAAEISPKYEKIYAYLNDDVHKSGVTLELAVRTFNPDSGTDAEQQLLSRAGWTEELTLVRYFLDESAHAVGSNKLVRLDPRIVRFLSNVSGADTASDRPIQVITPIDLSPLLIQQDVHHQLVEFATARKDVEVLHRHNTYFQLEGPSGSGKHLQALHFCQHFHSVFIQLDLRDVPRQADPARRAVRALVREAVLLDGVIAICGFEEVNKEEGASLRRMILEELTSFSGFVFLLSRDQVRLSDYADRGVVLPLSLPIPSTSERNQLWQAQLSGVLVEEGCLGEVATKFRLSPGQIQSAARNAIAQALWKQNGDEPLLVSSTDLHYACYQQSEHQLGERATRLSPRYGFRDLVLPDAQMDLLENACNHMRRRATVYEEWGFAKRVAYGRGIALLFAGPPGTGKTMGAEVMGYELGMEVYKIDMAQVISKYVGETEKNLREVFREASRSQAILFFDEADALFGKRSEVKDAHDKYANVETAFLLQQMEQYDGITVLATNLYQNIDEAFIRRLTYVVKFPFPDESYREHIWRGMFPAQAPIAADVDFPFLAKKFSISGGLIKNIVVGAAFLAARSGTSIGMQQILLATRDELNKAGNLFRADDLGPYADLLHKK